MFPNVRLMIVAVIASIVGMSCGLGVFAVFRVNHDPFVGLTNGAPPLQLVFSNAVPTAMTDAIASPFGVRFDVGALQPAPSQTRPQVIAAPHQSEPATAPSGATPAALPPLGARDADTAPAAALNKAAEAAIEAPARHTAPTDHVIPDSKPAPASAATHDRKRAEKSARPAPKRQRVAKLRRLHPARTTAVPQSSDQTSALSQPTYQFTPAVPAKPAKARRAARNSTATSSQ